MNLRLLLCLSFAVTTTVLFAQPANDECENAIPLLDVTNWCSEIAEFTNENATESGFGAPSCFPENGNDVWFVFTPIATDVTITIIGNTFQGAGGTLDRPELALYTGDCNGTLFEEQCESDVQGNDVIELYKGGMAVGIPHYIRVQGRTDGTGTFELCINNYNPPVNPGSDCFTGAILCNKESFVVQAVTGAGQNPTEANDADCLNGFGGNVESNSTWFAWTAATNGTLTFTLSPLSPADDLDFVLYELLDNSIDCGAKVPIRCMASGSFQFPSPCMGPTGLNDENTDLSEPPGCDDPNNQDNFLAALDMVQGTSYALMVNNFSSSGNGFSISFGGTGEFVGPEAGIDTDEPDETLCIGESITFTDASSFQNGSITEWEWDFGPGASPTTANTQGPHTVSYDTPGLKSVILTISTDRGCIVTEIATVLVECCDDHFDIDQTITDALCGGIPAGAIDLTINNNYAPYAFIWSNGENTEDITNLNGGNYSVTVIDQATCTVELSFEITEPNAIEYTIDFVMPTCGGGTDGSITINPNGGVPPYEYNWEGTGFTPDNTLANISQGTYNVIIQDQNGCTIQEDILLTELILELDPMVEAVTPPTCDGFNDGSIILNVINGQPPYEFDWNDGNGFVDENSILNIAAGTYNVVVRDVNLCQGVFEFSVDAPEPLAVDFDIIDVSCNGLTDGSILASPSGGVGGYSLAWSNGDNSESITELAPGNYTLTITDDNGCILEEIATVIEPVAVLIQLESVVDIICNGDSTGVITVNGIGGVPPYEYSINGTSFQSSNIFTDLFAGDYIATVRDAEGCTASIEVFVNEAAALEVFAGEGVQVNLGATVTLQAIPNQVPVTYSWTPTEPIVKVPAPDSSTIEVLPLNSTSFEVTIVNEDGCSASSTVNISVFKARPFYAPTAFSPNGDGRNDRYTIFAGNNVRIIRSLKIFDRWGELVFENEDMTPGDLSQGWDGAFKGEDMQMAVFAYVAEIEFIDDAILLFEGDFALVK